MKCLSVPLSVILCLTLPSFGQVPAESPQPFDGRIEQLTTLGDGTVVLATNRAIYLSEDESLTKWTATVAPLDHGFVRVLGGEKDRILLGFDVRDVFVGNSRLYLYAWTPAEGLQKQERMIWRTCQFVDSKAGLFMEEDLTRGASIVLTRDGGRTWLMPQWVFREEGILPVWQVDWATPSTVMVKLSMGQFHVLEMQADRTMKVQWSLNRETSVAMFGSDRRAPDGNAWLIVAPKWLQVRRLANGELLAKAELERLPDYIEVLGNRAFVCSDGGGVQVWGFQDGKLQKLLSNPVLRAGFFVRTRLGLFCISGNPELREPMRVTQLDEESLKAVSLTLVVNNDAVTRAEIAAELREMREIAKTLTPEEYEKVAGPILSRTDLTSREQTRMITEELREAIREKYRRKPGGPDTQTAPSDRPTSAQIIEVTHLTDQLNSEERKRIVDGILAIPGLTERQQMQRTIDEFRKAIEAHSANTQPK